MQESKIMAVRALSDEGDTISRQAAIDAVAKWFYDVFGIKESDGTATIFKRLRELPSAQSDVSDINVGDTIYRQAAIKAFDDAGFCTHGYIVDVLGGLPSAQTERKKGKWLVDEDGNMECPFCGNTCGFGNYCNECGADLRGERNEID